MTDEMRETIWEALSYLDLRCKCHGITFTLAVDDAVICVNCKRRYNLVLQEIITAPKEHYAIVRVTDEGQQELMLSASPTEEEALNDLKEMIISRYPNA